MAARKQAATNKRFFRINNMLGLVSTTLEENAYTTLDPAAKLGVGFTTVKFQFKWMENWKPNNYGGISKTHGFNLFKDVGSSTKINGLYRYNISSGTSLFIVAYGTTIKKLVSGTLSNIGAGMTVADKFIDFTTAYDKMIVCDGTGTPQTFDGTTVANMVTVDALDIAAVAGAKVSVFHKQRIFLFSATHDSSQIFYSDAGDISAGYGSNFVQCNINDGQKITGIEMFFIPGTLESVLVVSKERSTGVIIGDGTTANPYTYLSVDETVGCPGSRQMVQFEQDVAFFTPQGMLSYQAAANNQNIQREFLSDNIRNQFTDLLQTNLANALVWLDWKHYRVSVAMPTSTNVYADTIWHYDLRLRGWYSQTGFTTTSAFVDTDGTLYTGSDTGKIYQHLDTNHSYAGSPINAVARTPYLDFFEPYYDKRMVDARVIARGNGSYSFGIATDFNYGTRAGGSHSIPISSGAYFWGGGVWTDDPTVYQWGTVPLVDTKLFPKGMFNNVAFTFTQAGVDQPLDLLELMLEIENLTIF